MPALVLALAFLWAAGALGLEATRPMHCQTSSPLVLSRARIVHNNLGGLGPGHGENVIEYENVGTLRSGNPFSLVISNTSVYHVGSEQRLEEEQGLHGLFGKIAVAAGTAVGLRFQFLDTFTRMPAKLDNVILTFFDLEYQDVMHMQSFAACGASGYYLSDSAQPPVKPTVRVLEDSPHLFCTAFESGARGGDEDDPLGPNVLTDAQKARSVSVQYSQKAEVNLTFAVGGQKDGRLGGYFLFAGPSTVDGCVRPGTTTSTTETSSTVTTAAATTTRPTTTRPTTTLATTTTATIATRTTTTLPITTLPPASLPLLVPSTPPPPPQPTLPAPPPPALPPSTLPPTPPPALPPTTLPPTTLPPTTLPPKTLPPTTLPPTTQPPTTQPTTTTSLAHQVSSSSLTRGTPHSAQLVPLTSRAPPFSHSGAPVGGTLAGASLISATGTTLAPTIRSTSVFGATAGLSDMGMQAGVSTLSERETTSSPLDVRAGVHAGTASSAWQTTPSPLDGRAGTHAGTASPSARETTPSPLDGRAGTQTGTASPSARETTPSGGRAGTHAGTASPSARETTPSPLDGRTGTHAGAGTHAGTAAPPSARETTPSPVDSRAGTHAGTASPSARETTPSPVDGRTGTPAGAAMPSARTRDGWSGKAGAASSALSEHRTTHLPPFVPLLAVMTTTLTSRTTTTRTTSTITTTTTMTTATTTSTATTVTTRTSTAAPHLWNCLSGEMAEWGEDKRSFCCSKEHIGCEGPVTTTQSEHRFNCQVELDPLDTGWSEEKKAWCCEHEQVRCADIVGRDASEAIPHYDCEAGKAHWETEWSAEQKYFCCTETGISCQAFQSSSTSAPPPPAATPLLVPTAAPYVAPPLVTLAPLPTLAPLATLAPLPTLPPPTLAPALGTQISSVLWAEATGREPFDCQAGLSDWHGDWSKIKKDWCCEKEGLGCFDCQVALANADADWSEAKRSWCCSNENLGCAYDCDHQDVAWSDAQRQWCCDTVGAGCQALGLERKFESLRGQPLGKAGAMDRVAWRIRGVAAGMGLAACALLAVMCSRAQRLSTYHALRLDVAPQGFLSGDE